MRKLLKTAMTATILALGCIGFSAQADDEKMYAVTITNLTPGISFTPILVTTHSMAKPVFTLGTPASTELAAIAESGNTAPLLMKMTDSGIVYDSASSGGLLGPGQSVTVNVMYKDGFSYISLAGMLLPTNDGFIAINGMKGPKKAKRIVVPAYDAGSEINDELCASIPGPHCGGEAISVADGEGFVHIHSGIHGGRDLMANKYDWRNPAALVTIKRMK